MTKYTIEIAKDDKDAQTALSDHGIRENVRVENLSGAETLKYLVEVSSNVAQIGASGVFIAVTAEALRGAIKDAYDSLRGKDVSIRRSFKVYMDGQLVVSGDMREDELKEWLGQAHPKRSVWARVKALFE